MEKMDHTQYMNKVSSSKLSWRIKQQRFFKEPVEFEQDQRIKDFFAQTLKEPTLSYGDISYFNKINFSENYKKYNQCLLIFNKLIEKSQLFNIIKEIESNKLNNDARVCICINKFLIYSQTEDKNCTDDYDQAIFEFISNIFVGSRIEYFFVENLNGNYFNFGSPTTQFLITYKAKS